MLDNANDQDIVKAFAAGDTDAAARAFVRKYQSFVFSTALRYLRNDIDAEDASQETFIKALRALPKFRGDSSLSTWLYRITANVCKGMLRKRKLRTMLNLEVVEPFAVSTSPGPDRLTESNEFEAKFEVLLQTLPPKQRETFVLRYYEQRSYEEISAMLGTSVGGLKANYHQAAKKLALALEGEYRGQ